MLNVNKNSVNLYYIKVRKGLLSWYVVEVDVRGEGFTSIWFKSNLADFNIQRQSWGRRKAVAASVFVSNLKTRQDRIIHFQTQDASTLFVFSGQIWLRWPLIYESVSGAVWSYL